jgi:hypothetical protein
MLRPYVCALFLVALVGSVTSADPLASSGLTLIGLHSGTRGRLPYLQREFGVPFRNNKNNAAALAQMYQTWGQYFRQATAGVEFEWEGYEASVTVGSDGLWYLNAYLDDVGHKAQIQAEGKLLFDRHYLVWAVPQVQPALPANFQQMPLHAQLTWFSTNRPTLTSPLAGSRWH